MTLALTYPHFLGVDPGAYLLSHNVVLGDEPTGAGFERPWLAPGLQLVPFIAVLGDDNGIKVWSALAAIAPLFGVWLLARLFLTDWQAVFAVAFVSMDMFHSEMFVTGALPLQGFALIAVAIWAITRIRDKVGGSALKKLTPVEVPGELSRAAGWGSLIPPGTLRYTLILIATIPLIAHVNHTSTGLALILLPVYAIAVAVFGRRTEQALSGARPRYRWGSAVFKPLEPIAPVLLAFTIGGLLALSALPWYIGVAPGSAIFHYPGFWVRLQFWPDSSWFQFIVIAPVAYWTIRYGKDYRVRAMGVMVATLCFLLMWNSTDETIINIFYRARYLLAIFAYPAIAWIVFRYWWKPVWKPLAWAAMVTVACLVTWEYVNSFHGQARYSLMISDDTEAALEYLNEVDGQSGVITNAFTMALWVSALNKVVSPHPWTWEPPRAYTKSDRDVRCVLNWHTLGDIDDCSPATASRRLGVAHVLVDTRFPFYNERAPPNYGAPEEGQWQVTGSAPWLELIYEHGSTKLWRIR